MTAVDQIGSIGRPLDLATVMQQQVPAKPVHETATAKSGFSFGDFVDVINPLQHIPGIAELYRSVTNDQISDDARKTGNVLYGFALGGPVGLGAMLAYNALGDRLQDGTHATENEPVAAAEAVAAETAGANDQQDIPVPLRKPDVNSSATSQPAAEALLGQTVAKAAQEPEYALTLSGLFQGDRVSNGEAAVTPSLTAASSVAYVEQSEADKKVVPVMPTEDGLSRLATHQSNHLPLDVLKALQERHAQRTSSESS